MILIQHNTLEDFVKHQTQALCEIWHGFKDDEVAAQRPVLIDEKLKNEEKLSALLDWAADQLEMPALSPAGRNVFSTEAAFRLKKAGKEIFGLNEEQVDCFEKLGINRSAVEFFQQAREFNPFISFEDIFQAGRNVWTCSYLQVLLGLPVSLTPSIFAYSMLYPVSDNYLDDPGLSRIEKLTYNNHFRAWLKGEKATPHNWNEQDVRDLVHYIEEQYPRDLFPQVYESLLAIHNAQDKSMRIPRLPIPADSVDIAAITFEKGGASVLADGVLANGELSDEQMEIIFNYGAFAQLMDDQEDVMSDLKEGSLTLFTEAASSGYVDRTMNRVFNFAHQVLKGLDQFDPPQAIPLKQMSMKGIDLLLIDAVLRNEQYYSKAYLMELEKYFPFRFEYLKRVRRIIHKKKITGERLIRLFNIDTEPGNEIFDRDRATILIGDAVK